MTRNIAQSSRRYKKFLATRSASDSGFTLMRSLKGVDGDYLASQFSSLKLKAWS